LAKKQNKVKTAPTPDQLLKAFFEECKRQGRILPRAEYRELSGQAHGKIEFEFGTWSKFVTEMIMEYPEIRDYVFTYEDFSDSVWATTLNKLSKYKTFIVTTAISGGKIDKKAMAAAKNLAKRRNAALCIIPSGNDLLQLDPALKGELLLFNEFWINSNLKVLPVNLSPTSVKPQTGMARVGARACSVILGAPKLSKDSIPTDNDKLPHLIMTTGAITSPAYKKKGVLVNKQSFVASSDHNMSAILVEVEGDLFWERVLEFNTDGSVVDVNEKGAERFFADGSVKKEVPLNLNVGDWHAGETSAITYEAWPELAKLVKPKSISLHDVFSFHGHSHHTADNLLETVRIAENNLANPLNEFKRLAMDLSMWSAMSPTSLIKIVASNHNEHLRKAIQERNLDKPETFRIFCDLSIAALDGNDPVEYGIKKYAKFSNKNVEFMTRESRHVYRNKSGEILLHLHGDVGGNGSRGGASGGSGGSLAVSSGCAIVGHTHTPGIFPGNTEGSAGNGGLWINGTSTCINRNRPAYARGSASSWLQTSTLLFGQEGGRFTRTQLTVVDGRIFRGGERYNNAVDEVYKPLGHKRAA